MPNKQSNLPSGNKEQRIEFCKKRGSEFSVAEKTKFSVALQSVICLLCVIDIGFESDVATDAGVVGI